MVTAEVKERRGGASVIVGVALAALAVAATAMTLLELETLSDS